MINFGIAVLVLIILVCLGIPVAYSMGLSSAFYILLADPQYLEILPNRSITGVNNFLLLAIPFFILASEIMGKTGLTSKLFNFARLFVGRFRGGLAFVNIIASTIFGSVSGSAIAVLYALILGFVVFHNMKWKDLKECLWNTCKSVGNLMLIVAFANAFSWVAAIEKVPDEIAALLMSISSNKYVLLMIVNVFYIFVGMIMDTGAAIILFAPIIGPVLTMVGVNPVHLAMVTIMNLTIGLLTPPVGLVLFTAVNVGKRPFGAVVKAFWPFIIISYLALFVVTFIPQIVTWLPGALGFQIALS